VTGRYTLVVILDHACTALKTSLKSSESRKQLLQTSQLLPDFLSVYHIEEESAGIFDFGEDQLKFHEECLSIVTPRSACNTFGSGKVQLDRSAQI
jgi:hypothetical protein